MVKGLYAYMHVKATAAINPPSSLLDDTPYLCMALQLSPGADHRACRFIPTAAVPLEVPGCRGNRAAAKGVVVDRLIALGRQRLLDIVKAECASLARGKLKLE